MEFINGTVTGKNYDFLVVNTAATFTTLTGTGSENLLTAYNFWGFYFRWHRYQRSQWR